MAGASNIAVDNVNVDGINACLDGALINNVFLEGTIFNKDNDDAVTAIDSAFLCGVLTDTEDDTVNGELIRSFFPTSSMIFFFVE